jgi:hypothetical protein
MTRRIISTALRCLARRPQESLADKVDALTKEVESLREFVRYVQEEQSGLHRLVTGSVSERLQCLNRGLYDLKGDLFYRNLPADAHAFNGQFGKHAIFREMCSVFQFQAFVETGAYLGGTTAFLALRGKPVYSIEIEEEFYHQAAERLEGEAQVELFLGDSPVILDQLTKTRLHPDDLAFFYLDAHWLETLPLPVELRIIAAQHARAVVMIDDFKVEDDPGYGFDSYADGREISMRFLAEELRGHCWKLFFPSLPSARDHMLVDILPVRGTAVVACDQEIAAMLGGMETLRCWPLGPDGEKPTAPQKIGSRAERIQFR